MVIGKGSGNACNVGRSKDSSPPLELEVALIILNGKREVGRYSTWYVALHDLGRQADGIAVL